MEKTCLGCNKQKQLKYNSNTICHTCYSRLRRTGSYERHQLKCKDCGKQLFFHNKSGYCEPCRREVIYEEEYKKQRARISSNLDKEKNYQKQYRLDNKDAIALCKKTWYEINKNSVSLKARKDYLENTEIKKEKSRLWAKNNQKKRYITDKIRTERKKMFGSKDEKLKVKLFYKNCPQGFTVDHIIPLNNKDVCGLHIVCNLQYLSPTENFQKHNKFDYTYDNKSWKLNLKVSNT